MLDAAYEMLLELSPWLLLGALIAGVIHVALPADFVRRVMGGRGGVVRAVLLGVPLPLCSCGVIPAGLGLKQDGASNGAAVGFLIATPQTGVDSLLVSAGLLGWPFAVFKLLSAFVLGLFGGHLVEHFDHDATREAPAPSRTVQRNGAWWRELVAHAVELIRMIWGWLVVGIAVSAVLTQWLPPMTWHQGIGGTLIASFVALLISLPLYVCATASVPIAAALVAGGLPLGAALVFLVAGPATNVATMGAVYRNFGGRTLALYLGTLVVGSLAFGLCFDFVVGGSSVPLAPHPHDVVAGWRVVPALLLTGLVGWFALSDLRAAFVKLARRRDARAGIAASEIEVFVEGMTCQGCARRLQTRLAELEGVRSAEVSFEGKRAVLRGSVDRAQVELAVRQAGFDPGFDPS